MNSCMLFLSQSSAIASRTFGSLKAKCLLLTLPRSPSTSFHGSVMLTWMNSMSPPGTMCTLPLPPASMRLSTSSSTCRFQA